MPDQPTETPARRSRHVRRTDWRLGGRTVLGWREMLLAVSLLSLGVGLIAGYAVRMLWPGSGMLSTLCVWFGMVVPIVMAYTRSRPIGLLRLRPSDLLYGVVLGVALRFVHGALAGAEGEVRFPSLTTVDGALDDGWWFTELVAPALVAPLVETFFFWGVVLVALYTVLRRRIGVVGAGVVAWAVVIALFVFTHAAVSETSNAAVVSLAMLGAVCGTLVLLTGRIWGAVLVHVVYNTTYVALALVGTALG